MKVLYNWLKEFVDLTATPEDLRTRLSLSGTAVEALEQTSAGPMLDAEFTSNRADCLGHYGIAREAAALYRVALKPVEPHVREATEKAASATRVEIESPETDAMPGRCIVVHWGGWFHVTTKCRAQTGSGRRESRSGMR